MTSNILTKEKLEKICPNIYDIEDINLINKIHDIANKNNYDKYIDPYTEYSVFTEYYLKKRKCCGNECRHCPWNHINVKKK